MSRTRRIYNSYRRYGRFQPKYTSCCLKEPPKPYPIGIPNEDHRWHPYYVWFNARRRRSECYDRKREKQRKTTVKRTMVWLEDLIPYQDGCYNGAR